MRTETLTCDCGCGVSESRETAQASWLVVWQHNYCGVAHGDPKINDQVHFASFSCLSKWAKNACEIIPQLQASAADLRPCGMITDDNLQGVYI